MDYTDRRSDTQAIWKFTAPFSDYVEMSLPRGARVLSAQVSGSMGLVTVWALVGDTMAPRVPRQFMVVGTGHPFVPQPGDRFLSTVLEGPFVWHIWALDPDVPLPAECTVRGRGQ